MTASSIVMEVIGPVATITINRPDRMNAIDPDAAQQMIDALDQAVALGARALKLTGEGRGFCSGADLADVGGDGFKNEIEGLLDKIYNPLIRALSQLPIPWVAAVNGPAVGFGCSLALQSDLVVAGKSAYFTQSFTNLGLVPDGGGSWILPRLVGLPRAAEMILLGERVPAEKAASWGLIHSVVDDSQVQATAGNLVERLANGPTMALGLARRLLRDGLERNLDQSLDAERDGQVAAANSADAVEGVMALIEKRQPNFSGR